jgi:hypothetical protein
MELLDEIKYARWIEMQLNDNFMEGRIKDGRGCGAERGGGEHP